MHLVIRQSSPGQVHLELHGGIDQHDVDIFLHECLALLQAGWRNFSVDFSSCLRFDESLLKVFRPLQEQGAVWHFIAPQPKLFHHLQQLRFEVSLHDLVSSAEKTGSNLIMPF
ncbi:hypothetical protein COW36_15485 [bacterium (Candidatus Blackallbacteria) CG17_big_fil_post_rev_8_21_14_2_50_48_46]|uniref:STAS domain-containing protein n=1 Tax=bacterium (Candidatus Blackallbacteria) CG17_big_fil_post_rev_8_21_14_2_50_48_46 TaxID=2014261 RepID=A0A2M7G262_9BACT|nr:MAG: hypothetical protein COW64_07750 [bacterium (Candidatus Blackallbacteria) CG18_big_fil_WC_8_21_14_2_50_49_26]PIW15871.1 MAG: hypothetical protein COW36_15485 [bacterium (Candidatus Blackallbacteria) CG17_big_fil_post_rev_8_21_14_2_50_48_46]PIW48663.1 MAG: hypothetical protein COW20_08685 [bacterium (Candidatus Blackallbacteria) CG13_big_fil_rev_8_21_14_2_50_49_14]